MGGPAYVNLTRDDEYQIGRMEQREIREDNLILDDAETTDYLQNLGLRLASQAGTTGQNFQYYALREPSINAFATFGGFVYVHTGLILLTESEAQLASVMAHETGHVLQRHMARAIQAEQQISLSSAAAMLAAVLIGAASGGGAGAMEGAIAVSQGIALQRSINFTRSEEIEADAVGIQLLAGAGFDPQAMPAFFEALARSEGLAESEIPALLQDHPVTAERIAAARQRASAMTASPIPTITVEEPPGPALARNTIPSPSSGGDGPAGASAATPAFTGGTGASNVPAGARTAAVANIVTRVGVGQNYAPPSGSGNGSRYNVDSPAYAFIRERVRVVAAAAETNLLQYYANLREQRPLSPAERYGEALAQMRAGQTESAVRTMAELQKSYPQLVLLYASLGQALMADHQQEAGLSLFEHAIRLFPRNVPLSVRYAEALMQANKPEQAHQLLLDLFNNAEPTPDQIWLTALAASTAGDTGDAYYYMSYYALSGGNLVLANQQLELALAAPHLTTVQRKRFRAQLDEVRGYLREQQRSGRGG
jgi:predicted Zn-dependent protease